MLEDIRQVYVTIDHAGVEPNAPPIDWMSLQSQIEKRLEMAGIKLAPEGVGQIENMSELRFTVKMLSMPETEQFVFHIEMSLHEW